MVCDYQTRLPRWFHASIQEAIADLADIDYPGKSRIEFKGVHTGQAMTGVWQ